MGDAGQAMSFPSMMPRFSGRLPAQAGRNASEHNRTPSLVLNLFNIESFRGQQRNVEKTVDKGDYADSGKFLDKMPM